MSGVASTTTPMSAPPQVQLRHWNGSPGRVTSMRGATLPPPLGTVSGARRKRQGQRRCYGSALAMRLKQRLDALESRAILLPSRALFIDAKSATIATVSPAHHPAIAGIAWQHRGCIGRASTSTSQKHNPALSRISVNWLGADGGFMDSPTESDKIRLIGLPGRPSVRPESDSPIPIPPDCRTFAYFALKNGWFLRVSASPIGVVLGGIHRTTKKRESDS